MKVIDILNQLDEKGQLVALYRSGCINVRTYAYRDVYLRWQTLRASMRYYEDNAGAVRQVAAEMEISVPSVYRAIAGMEKTTEA
ncbi:hypothetical protein [Hymenobacter metallicola]|uniref:Mor transcription activator domain-containing protein n=1 Tax=Hymenobacter metallicola TaxID=2563114 RepID=A0A4Z0QIY8_9BACT|nr:hypothetical protein [Hymenobacter metallicola]TGE29734.1 hypothetical protein E5K02_09825 [Hymenobacter metallicola]